MSGIESQVMIDDAPSALAGRSRAIAASLAGSEGERPEARRLPGAALVERHSDGDRHAVSSRRLKRVMDRGMRPAEPSGADTDNSAGPSVGGGAREPSDQPPPGFPLPPGPGRPALHAHRGCSPRPSIAASPISRNPAAFPVAPFIRCTDCSDARGRPNTPRCSTTIKAAPDLSARASEVVGEKQDAGCARTSAQTSPDWPWPRVGRGWRPARGGRANVKAKHEPERALLHQGVTEEWIGGTGTTRLGF